MTQLSIQQAADKAQVTRQTIYKKINDGELSATVDHKGNKQIDVTELLRVYPNLTTADSSRELTVNKLRHVKASANTSVLQLELDRAQMLLQLRDRELQLAQERIDELRSREAESKSRERDALEEKQRLLGVIEKQTLLLAAPVPAKSPARPKAAPVAKPKPKAKAQVAKPPAKPVQARKTAVKPAAKKATAKPVAKPTRSTAAAAKKVVKKATRK